MATKKNPARDAALKEYVKRRGKVTMKTLSEKLDVSISQLGRWKRADDWEGALKKKPGAPKGNKNAVGAGAPKKNKNAEKHGAYSSVKFTDLAPEQRAQVEAFCELPLEGRLNEQLKDMLAQKVVLLERAQIYAPLVENGEVIELMVPDKKSVFNNGDKEFTTITSVSQFHRWIKIIEKIEDINKSINKVLQSMSAQQRDEQRLDLDERKHNLEEQKASGIFEIESADVLGDPIDDLDLIGE